MTESEIDFIDEMQSSQNDGRGIQCVKDILVHLRKGQFEIAKGIADWDSDKIRSYPDLYRYMVMCKLITPSRLFPDPLVKDLLD